MADGCGYPPDDGFTRLIGLPATAELRNLSAPTLRREQPGLPPRQLLTFVDLIELYVTGIFRRHGVSLSTIRAIAQRAARELNCGHPLASQQFHTEGGRLLAAMEEEAALPERLSRELPKARLVLDGLAVPFFERLDYEGGQARRYWPLGRQKLVCWIRRGRWVSPSTASRACSPRCCIVCTLRVNRPSESRAGMRSSRRLSVPRSSTSGS